MTEQNTADALQARIEEAQASGDDATASRLYREQQGTTDPYGLEPGPPPEVPNTDGDVPAETVSHELTVATGAEDETVTVTPEMDFARNSEHVTQALDAMLWWDRDENGKPNSDRVEQLKRKWGSDLGANLAHFQAFALAHPDINEILTASGFGDHPIIVEVGAILGRRYATTAGDPSRITTQKGDTKMSQSTNTAAIEARIEALGDEIDQAKARSDMTKANNLFREQQALFRLLPGGLDPVVGDAGRSV